MKFKVLYGVKPNMFGRLGGHTTLIGDDNSTPYSIEWFLNKIIDLFNMGLEDDETINIQKNNLLDNFIKMEIGKVLQIVNKEDITVALIQRVDENTKMEDLLAEEYGF